MYRNLWVTSDVQFRRGASIPPFLGGAWLTLLLGQCNCINLFHNCINLIHNCINLIHDCINLIHSFVNIVTGRQSDATTSVELINLNRCYWVSESVAQE